MYIHCVVAVFDFNANVDRPNKEVGEDTVFKLKVYNGNKKDDWFSEEIRSL